MADRVSEQTVLEKVYDSSFKAFRSGQWVYDPTSDAISRAYPSNPLNLKPYDYVSRGLVSATETWTFKSGGSGGTTTDTVIVVYTDTTLANILTVTKT